MKTITDLNEMKQKSQVPFGNAYEYLIRSLEDYYISKSDGMNRIKHVLNDWDKEARAHIVEALIDRIGQSGIVGFNPTDLQQLV